MAAYNASKYINAAIDSVLNQTFDDFELLIVEDGSTDETLSIIESYHDDRITVIKNAKNLGLIASLNKGLDCVKGEYIARMDADDICLPDRLSAQLNFLIKNSEIGFCGTWFEKFTDHSSDVIQVPLSDGDIRAHLALDNAFAHNTIMFRRSFLEKHQLRYDKNFPYAEDYEFWVRCAKFTKLANMPIVTVRYRYHAENTSNSRSNDQRQTANTVRLIQLENLGIDTNQINPLIHNELMGFAYTQGVSQLSLSGVQLYKLYGILMKICDSGSDPLRQPLALRWFNACAKSADSGFETLKIAAKNPLFASIPLRLKAILLVRCILRKPIPIQP